MHKKRNIPKPPFTLDDEDNDILESFESGEWKSVDNLEEQKEVLKKAASNYIKSHLHLRTGPI